MNDVALITGASTGIGKELAKIHAQKGGDLVVVARNRQKLNGLKEELEKRHSVSVMVIDQDLSVSNAAEEVFREVNDAGVSVQYLINNAGFGGHGLFHERPWEQDFAMIQLNVLTLTHLTRLFLPGMVARGQGKILNVSSTASLAPGGPLQAVYFATKHFVTAFSYSIAEELKGTGVSVTALLPGATETEFAKTSGMDKTELFKKTASARDVAQDGYNGMLKGQLDVVTGLTFSQKIQGTLLPFLPKSTILKQIHQMQKAK